MLHQITQAIENARNRGKPVGNVFLSFEDWELINQDGFMPRTILGARVNLGRTAREAWVDYMIGRIEACATIQTTTYSADGRVEAIALAHFLLPGEDQTRPREAQCIFSDGHTALEIRRIAQEEMRHTWRVYLDTVASEVGQYVDIRVYGQPRSRADAAGIYYNDFPRYYMAGDTISGGSITNAMIDAARIDSRATQYLRSASAWLDELGTTANTRTSNVSQAAQQAATTSTASVAMPHNLTARQVEEARQVLEARREAIRPIEPWGYRPRRR